jgi:hypothetical protein
LIATHSGISVFNGEEFQNLPELEELYTEPVVKIIEYNDHFFFLLIMGSYFLFKHELQKVFEIGENELRKLKRFYFTYGYIRGQSFSK